MLVDRKNEWYETVKGLRADVERTRTENPIYELDSDVEPEAFDVFTSEWWPPLLSSHETLIPSKKGGKAMPEKKRPP